MSSSFNGLIGARLRTRITQSPPASRNTSPRSGFLRNKRIPTLKRRGAETRLVITDRGSRSSEPDPNLLSLLTQAQKWHDQLTQGECKSIREIARKARMDEGDVSRIFRLAFLSPEIVEAIVGGKQPLELTAEKLKRMPKIDLCWVDQRERMRMQ